jgi:hypothetical protein
MEPELLEPELWVADMAAVEPNRTTRPVVRDIWVSCRPNQSTALAHTCLRLRRRTRDSRVILDRADDAQFATNVVIRLGTSPTGTTALTVLLSVSMAVTDLMAAFEI